MKSIELRESFFKFFEKAHHTKVASSSIIPAEEPTLYFTNAGMVPFKGVFLGTERRDYKRATSIQKCLRVSGKHNDLEQVGHTPRHHTFFEMMGNFSFGDYFKKDAIEFAWEYLTKVLGLSKGRLIATVYEDDDEALKLWTKFLPKDRIFKLGEKDNFWSMGDVGPCGPCSEILWDFESGDIKKEALDSNRFMEIWNLVFMQYNRDANGKLEKLSKPSIDTGMGLERLACVCEGKRENWESDLFIPIIDAILSSSKVKYNPENLVPLRVIADHLRAMVFMIEAGLVPSNEGRGYILRRIIRRAVRFGKRLNHDEPFLFELTHKVIDLMGSVYPELVSSSSMIERVVHAEEERFYRTLDNGLGLLEAEFSKLKNSKKDILSGDILFKLYDTYGFPIDLTELIAKEENFKCDQKGFEDLLKKQRELSRANWKGSGDERVLPVFEKLAKDGVSTKFVGYDERSTQSKILSIVKDGKTVTSAKKGEKVDIVFEKTPFYGESGGQVGDKGLAVSGGVEIEIFDTKKPLPQIFLHKGIIKDGAVKVGDTLTLAIDVERRTKVCANHTATHLLHKALRETLGEHVRQSGSLVESDRLRFDFTHFDRVTEDELFDIERLVNKSIRDNLDVETSVMKYAEAVSKGALAFFGEKYGDSVRMVAARDFSCELCGGTHVRRTGDIGFLKITSEASIASGIRRIEAVTGSSAEELVISMQKDIEYLAKFLKSSPSELKFKIEKLVSDAKRLEKDLSSQKDQQLKGAEEFLKEVKKIGGISVLTIKLDGVDVDRMRRLSDELLSKIGSGIILIASVNDGRVSLIVSLTKDLEGKFHAGKIIGEVSAILGGKGGGKPNMAQGGGQNVAELDKAIERFEAVVRG